MSTNHSGRRLLLLVAVGIALLVAGSGAAVACDTCADQNEDDDEEYEPYWSNEEFPYNTSENRSFADIVVNETEEEMEEDLDDGNDGREANAGASAGRVAIGAEAEVDVAWTNATGGDTRGSGGVAFSTDVDG